MMPGRGWFVFWRNIWGGNMGFGIYNGWNGLFHLYYRIRMNYNQMNRNSLMSCIYSDRPGYNYPPAGENWRGPEQHLNPSKSKLNVRQSLNKTVENGPAPNSTLTSVRNSCLLTSATSAHPPRQDVFLEDKFFKASKENQEPISNPRQHFPRYSQVLPPTEERRKSDSAHFRAASSNDFLFKIEDFRPFDVDRERSEKQDRPERAEKTQPGEGQLREMLLALTKRVASSEEEIVRLKERDKRMQVVQGEAGELKGKLLDLAKYQAKGHADLEAKLQQQHQEMRERLAACEDWTKRSSLVERGLAELAEGIKNREGTERQVGGQLVALENNLKKLIGEEVGQLKTALQLSKKEATAFADRIKRLEVDYTERSAFPAEQYKKSTRKSITSLMLENKEILLVRENEPVRDRTRQLNLPQTSRRDLGEQRCDYLDTPRKDTEPKRELIIRQKVYFIDTSGYLLDENKYYLLNSKNQQILLPEHLILALRDNHMLTTPLSTPRR